MRAILIALVLAGCSVQPPIVWQDYRGKCHAISDGRIVFDVDCRFKEH